MKWIDFRSDTVTQPTEEMRQSMVTALVGDDVYGDDPTVNELEALAAKICKKEAALFVPTGTFGNQLALMTHTRRGDEVIIGNENHIFAHEVGAASVLSGVTLRQLPLQRGCYDLDMLEKSIREDDIHYPETGLICIENAHGSGYAIPLEHMREVKAIADKHKLPIHLDGARLFNAAACLDVEVSEILAYVDSAMFCLSKGLCAPVGSMLVGSQTFIDRARKLRKLMGGGMRQAGVLAAPGIIALTKMTARLKEDHARIKELSKGLQAIEHIRVLKDRCDINMVFFTVNVDHNEEIFVESFRELGMLINPTEDGEYRLVTHYWITDQNIEKFLSSIGDVLYRSML